MSISEYTEPAVLNAGAQHPHKTAVPVRYGNTYRLELEYGTLRRGCATVGFTSGRSAAWPRFPPSDWFARPKPANYEGSFRCSDPTLTRIWYTGAYTVKLNLLKEYFGAILMERSDRHSWTRRRPSVAGRFDGGVRQLRLRETELVLYLDAVQRHRRLFRFTGC